MRVAIYVRVSTADQSVEMQLRDLREYAKQRGFEIFKEYSDVGISGSLDSRPALNQLMNDARKRKFRAIIVWRFDRFARSTKHLITALEEFRGLKINFISFNENIDTSSALGEAIFTIIGAMAQLERNIIRERVVAGLENAKAKGRKLGRPQKVDPAEILKLRNDGSTSREIAAKLNISKRSVTRALKAA